MPTRPELSIANASAGALVLIVKRFNQLSFSLTHYNEYRALDISILEEYTVKLD